MALAPLKIAPNTAAGKTYWRDDVTYKKLVYIGPNNDGSGIDEYMKSYNLIPGKEYTIRNSLVPKHMAWVVDMNMNLPGNQPQRAIDITFIDVYFKPLSQLRDDKLNEILT